MISWHADRSFQDDKYAAGYQTADTVDLRRIANGISQSVWSPVVWKDGKRNEKNFIQAHFAVLDFDSGETTLEEAKKKFCDIDHVIGTTRNHQKNKGKHSACDRFRVVLLFEKVITDLRVFRWNMNKLIKLYGTDGQCKDGARFYYPCTKIVSILDDVGKMSIEEPPNAFENPCSVEPADQLTKLMWERYQRLPDWTDKFLKRGKPFEGKGRETSAFMVANQMRVAGLTENEAYSLLLTAPIDRTNFAENELKHAVKSAYKNKPLQVKSETA